MWRFRVEGLRVEGFEFRDFGGFRAYGFKSLGLSANCLDFGVLGLRKKLSRNLPMVREVGGSENKGSERLAPSNSPPRAEVQNPGP